MSSPESNRRHLEVRLAFANRMTLIDLPTFDEETFSENRKKLYSVNHAWHMTKKMKRSSKDLFELKFSGKGISPEKIPLRVVSDALRALQNVSAGRDPFESARVPDDLTIGLVGVRRGSATYRWFSRSPEVTLQNLRHLALLLASLTTADATGENDPDYLPAVLPAVRELSKAAKTTGAILEVKQVNQEPLFSVNSGSYTNLSRGLLMSGESSMYGTIERVGGVTRTKCQMRIANRRKLVYCDVASSELARELGERLYKDVLVTGTATWVRASWRILKFRIGGFSEPKLQKPLKIIQDLRAAGLAAWDSVDDPFQFLRGDGE